MLIFRSISKTSDFLSKISSLPGPFDKRTSSDLQSVFSLSYSSTLPTIPLKSLLKNRISESSQDFFLNAFLRYLTSLPVDQQVFNSKSIDVSHSNKLSLIDFFIRAIIMSAYDSGVTLSNSVQIIMPNGEKKGNHELMIKRGDLPICIVRSSKHIPQKGDNDMELAFISMIFEVFTCYHTQPVWPLFGCVTNARKWIFLKYDGKDFFRNDLELEIELEDIKKLSEFFVRIIDSI